MYKYIDKICLIKALQMYFNKRQNISLTFLEHGTIWETKHKILVLFWWKGNLCKHESKLSKQLWKDEW